MKASNMSLHVLFTVVSIPDKHTQHSTSSGWHPPKFYKMFGLQTKTKPLERDALSL